MRSALPMLATVLLAACGDDGGGGGIDTPVDAPSEVPDAAPRQVVMETKPILVGQIIEGKLIGGRTDSAKLTFTAPVAKLDWNVHGHANGGTQTLQEGFDVMSVSYTLMPPAQADWFLLLRNRDSAPLSVEVKIELYGNMQWTGWE